jgi:hypothetical protein
VFAEGYGRQCWKLAAKVSVRVSVEITPMKAEEGGKPTEEDYLGDRIQNRV